MHGGALQAVIVTLRASCGENFNRSTGTELVSESSLIMIGALRGLNGGRWADQIPQLDVGAAICPSAPTSSRPPQLASSASAGVLAEHTPVSGSTSVTRRACS